jgi:hypothetical protein
LDYDINIDGILAPMYAAFIPSKGGFCGDMCSFLCLCIPIADLL